MDESKSEKKAKKEALKKMKKEKHCEVCGSRRHYTEDHEGKKGREEDEE